jgi:hypothetical protein
MRSRFPEVVSIKCAVHHSAFRLSRWLFQAPHADVAVSDGQRGSITEFERYVP